MPVISVYRHGMTCGVAPMKNSHQRALRGEVGGWSDGATRRNTRFLYSIREQELDGLGFAVTLTLRNCPASAADWHTVRRSWIKRMERLGMSRLHWVTEWQRRGVPHLHCAVWFSPEAIKQHGAVNLYMATMTAWIALTGTKYGASHMSQHVREIDGAIGWFKYLSKHAARGIKHYQRSSDNLPAAWKTKTGRMWGHTGDWPVREAIKIELQGCPGDGGFYAFRRLVRSWRIADARGDAYRSRTAKRLLRCPQEPLSRVRGLSEWISEDLQNSLLANLATRGFSVVC